MTAIRLGQQIERYADSLRRELDAYRATAEDTTLPRDKRLVADHSAQRMEDALSALHVHTDGAHGTSRDELREVHPDPFTVA